MSAVRGLVAYHVAITTVLPGLGLHTLLNTLRCTVSDACLGRRNTRGYPS